MQDPITKLWASVIYERLPDKFLHPSISLTLPAILSSPQEFKVMCLILKHKKDKEEYAVSVNIIEESYSIKNTDTA